MSQLYFEVARATGAEYQFAVCMRSGPDCHHADKPNDHRRYTWFKDDGRMTVDSMVDEVTWLERQRLEEPSGYTVLSMEGAVLA